MKLNGTYQLLSYADDVNKLGGSIHTLKENAGILVAATKGIGLEVSADKLSTLSCLEIRIQDEITVRGLIIVLSRGWNILNTWEQLYNQKSIAEEIKSRLRLGNACYHSVQTLLSSGLPSNNLKIKKYRTIILPVILYGCETWLLILREERKVRVFENMVLRRIFGPRRKEVMGEWRRLHNEDLNDLYSSPNIVRVIKSRIMRLAGHVAPVG